jgi:creatinine amidohydrolase/Fe(II)-dependent formamide hydrolase-like protein
MKLSNVTSKKFAEKRESMDVIIIPIGSLEAYGEHLPLGTDIFSPREICQRIENQSSDAVTGDPGKATKEKDEEFFEMLAEKIQQMIQYMREEQYLNSNE